MGSFIDWFYRRQSSVELNSFSDHRRSATGPKVSTTGRLTAETTSERSCTSARSISSSPTLSSTCLSASSLSSVVYLSESLQTANSFQPSSWRISRCSIRARRTLCCRTRIFATSSRCGITSMQIRRLVSERSFASCNAFDGYGDSYRKAEWPSSFLFHPASALYSNASGEIPSPLVAWKTGGRPE